MPETPKGLSYVPARFMLFLEPFNSINYLISDNEGAIVKLGAWITAAVPILLFCSCATMIRGTHEQLQLSSNPEGAVAQLSNGQSCTTPCSLDEQRDASFAVTFSKDGCDEQMVSVFPTLAGSGVLLGGLIDYGTGAVYSLEPNPVLTTLKCRRIVATAPASDSAMPRTLGSSPSAAGVAPGEPAMAKEWERLPGDK